MTRALTSGEKTYLRSDGQHSRLYLAVFAPSTVFTAQVSATPSSVDELYEISYDNGSSGWANALIDQLIYVGSTAGAYDKGMARLRGTLSGVSGTMKVGEVSEINWANNDHITVVDEFPIAPRHLYITSGGTVYMDRDIAYSDQHQYPDPIPVLGPVLSVKIMTSHEITLSFDGSDSWTPDGGALTYSWSFPSAASTTGTSTATPTATYNAAGTYRYSCTVTRDYGGGHVKSFTAYRYIRIFNTTNDKAESQFTLESCSGSWDNQGWSFSIKMFANADRSTIRDRALVVLFADDWYGDTKVSIGPITDREEMVCLGWISGETIEWDKEIGAVTFQVEGPQFWIAQTQGFPSSLEDVQTTPTEWLDYQSLTFDAGMWHFMRWRCTVSRMMDFYKSGDTRGISLFNATGAQTLWAQINAEAEGTILAHPCCDRFGRLFIEIEPQLVPTGSRGSIPTIQTLLGEDLRRPISFERRVTPTTGLVDLSGIIYSAGSGSPRFSLAPGHIPKWWGANIDRRDRLALSSQAQANELCGLFLGWLNNEYPDFPLPMASNHRMTDICPHQYLDLTLSASDTVRGVAVNLTLIPRAVNYSYDTITGLLNVDIRTEATTVDTLADDGDIPESPPSPAPPPVPPVDTIPLPDLTAEWPMKVYCATKVVGVYYSSDFTGPDGTMPTWTKISSGLSTDTIHQFTTDRSESDKNERQFVIAEDSSGDLALYKRESQGSWTLVLDIGDCATITGITDTEAGASDAIHWVTVDEETARVYVLYMPMESSSHRLWVLWNDENGKPYDSGGVWSSAMPGGAANKPFRSSIPTGVVWSYNGDVVIFTQGEYKLGANPSTRGHIMYYATNPVPATTWSYTLTDTTSTSYSMQGMQNPFDATARGYAREFDSPDYELIEVDSGGDTLIEDGTDLNHYVHAWWFWSSALMRFVRAGNVGVDYPDLVETDDAFATTSDKYALPYYNIVGLARWVSSGDSDWIIYGANDCDGGQANTTQHHILVADAGGDGRATLTPKGGDNVGVSPYTSSIPETGDGIAWTGIQVAE